MLPKILGPMDSELSEMLLKTYAKKGIDFKLGCKVTGIEGGTVIYTDPDGNETVQQAIFDLENDFPSVFYYSGYIGFALYLAFIGYFALLIIVGLITRFNKLFTVESGMVGVTFLLALGTSQFSGNVLRRPNASIYLSVILAYIYWLTAIRENVRLRDIFNIFSKILKM